MVASARKVCMARWEEEMSETDLASISKRRLATAWKQMKIA